jgi:SOS-response transcriptional repressor LexA
MIEAAGSMGCGLVMASIIAIIAISRQAIIAIFATGRNFPRRQIPSMYENWLKEQLAEAPHGTKRVLAQRMGIDGPKLSKTLAGNRELSAAELARAVEFFGRSPPDLQKPPAGPRGVPIPPGGPLPYGGTVAAGDWLSVDDFNQDLADVQVPISVPRHPGYPQLEQIAWRVHGDSMTEAGILEGMWLVGAKYLDYVDRIGELDNGSYVVVERKRYQGAERELTVKEVQFARRGMRLIPRSSNPRHKEFFIDLDHDADPDTESVAIVGVVLWVGRDLAPAAK